MAFPVWSDIIVHVTSAYVIKKSTIIKTAKKNKASGKQRRHERAKRKYRINKSRTISTVGIGYDQTLR